MSNPLPSFEKPPVVETVLGIQFNPLPNLTVAHLGAFWKPFSAEYPIVREAATIKQQFERFGPEQIWNPTVPRFRVSNEPPIRLLLQTEKKDQMIQLQNGRLHYNWVKTEGDDPYPRYTNVRKQFDIWLERFREFLDQNSLDRKSVV